MPNLNKVMVMGNLTRDPELKTLQSGVSVVNFGIAINRKYKSGDDFKEEVTFLDIEAWGRRAEVIKEHLAQGSPIFIEGRLKYETWQDRNTGQKRSRLKVVAENFEFVGGRSRDQQGGGHGREGKQYQPQGQPKPSKEQHNQQQNQWPPDDVPF